jgi:hypothetical protein
MLHARFPKHELVVRNLGFSGDEIATRLRSRNFGTPDEWLRGHAAPVGGYQDNRLDGANTAVDVIFAFFGYNESYAGQEGLSAFRTQLGDWVAHTLEQSYNGVRPRLRLFAHRAGTWAIRSPRWRGNNRRLKLWLRRWRTYKAQASPSSTCSRERACASTGAPPTIQGVHLNARGPADQSGHRPRPSASETYQPSYRERLRQAVPTKAHWFNRYRTTDGFATRDRGSSRSSKNRERFAEGGEGRKSRAPDNKVLQREIPSSM